MAGLSTSPGHVSCNKDVATISWIKKSIYQETYLLVKYKHKINTVNYDTRERIFSTKSPVIKIYLWLFYLPIFSQHCNNFQITYFVLPIQKDLQKKLFAFVFIMVYKAGEYPIFCNEVFRNQKKPTIYQALINFITSLNFFSLRSVWMSKVERNKPTT